MSPDEIRLRHYRRTLRDTNCVLLVVAFGALVELVLIAIVLVKVWNQ